MRGIRALALLIALLCANAAQAATVLPYSSLFVFGDSLVDSGNARLATVGTATPAADPSQGYVNGRFSNGPNFADYLSQALTGGPATAFLAGGSNFAVGGALTAFSPTERSRSFVPQFLTFDASPQTIGSDSLVLVTFGGNDVRSVLTNTGPVDFTPAVNALVGGLNSLVGAGARNIVVTGLPDIGQLPRTFLDAAAAGDQTIPQIASERSTLLNARFAAATALVAQQTGANLQFFDLLGFEMDVLADPAAFGLPAGLNTTTSCQQAGAQAVLAGCAGYLYFDPIHPTTQVHAAIAQGIVAQLAAVPEPSTWAMMLIGFAWLGALLRRRRRGMGDVAEAMKWRFALVPLPA